MKIFVTGATGLIGRALVDSLRNEGHSIVTVSRKPDNSRLPPGVELYQCDLMAGPPPAEALAGVEAIVHLAGEPIADERWTTLKKQRIRDSRVIGTKNLVDGLSLMQTKPSLLVGASAVGFYGDRGDEALDEDSSPGNDFLSQICQEWEREEARASELGMRVAQVRTGVVLSTEGGALARMLPSFRLGVAGPLGSGKQWFPWVHIADVVGILRHAIVNSAVSGPVNAVAPGVVTNAEFTRTLAGVLHRPAFLPAPAFLLRLALGEMAEMLLASQRVVPKVAVATGYQFLYPTLSTALNQLLGAKAAAAGQSAA